MRRAPASAVGKIAALAFTRVAKRTLQFAPRLGLYPPGIAVQAVQSSLLLQKHAQLADVYAGHFCPHCGYLEKHLLPEAAFYHLLAGLGQQVGIWLHEHFLHNRRRRTRYKTAKLTVAGARDNQDEVHDAHGQADGDWASGDCVQET